MLKALNFVKISGIILMAILSFYTFAAPAKAQLTDQQLGVQYGAATGLTNVDIRVTAARIIRQVLGLLGIIAVVGVIYGGFVMMTAGGNEEKVGEAKKWIFASVIGLAIILSAYSITTFILDSLLTATTYPGPSRL